jgi:integrase/recombinase XerD
MVNPKQPSPDILIDQFLNYLVVEKGLSKKTVAAYSRDINRYRIFIAEKRTLP